MKVLLGALAVFVSIGWISPAIAEGRIDAMVCHYKDANGELVGRVQVACNGTVSRTLYSGKSWDDATEVNCNPWACTLGEVCEAPRTEYMVDGFCTCTSQEFIDEIVDTYLTNVIPSVQDTPCEW